MDELKLINEIDKKLDALVLWFALYFMRSVNPRLKRMVLDALDRMDFNDTSLQGRLKRDRELNRLSTALYNSLGVKDGVMAVGVAVMVEKYKELTGLANSYFSVLSSSYDKTLYKELYKDSLTVLKRSMGGRGFKTKLVNDLIQHLYTMNVRGLRKEELRVWLNGYFAEKGQSARYAATVANDTMYTLTRIIQNRVSADLNIGYWLYAGTLIRTSRHFCTTKTGRAYTTAQVRAWADLTWDGKIAGTNRTNIFERVGGHGCRHTLRPISKRVYDYINAEYEKVSTAA